MKAETIRAVRSRIRHIICGSENFRMPVHPAAGTRDDRTFYSSITHQRLLPCQCPAKSTSIILLVTLLQVNFTQGTNRFALHFLIITNFISSEKGHLERNNIVVPDTCFGCYCEADRVTRQSRLAILRVIFNLISFTSTTATL